MNSLLLPRLNNTHNNDNNFTAINNMDEVFDMIEGHFSVVSDSHENSVKYVYWKNKRHLQQSLSDTNSAKDTTNTNTTIPTTTNKTCIFYLHTNTRSVLEAVEILELCYYQNYDLFAIDLPAHGQTNTYNNLMSASLTLSIIDHGISLLRNNYFIDDVILYARGMSTAIAIEYCVLPSPPHPSAINTTLKPTHPDSFSSSGSGGSKGSFVSYLYHLFHHTPPDLNPNPYSPPTTLKRSSTTPLYNQIYIKTLILDTPYTSIHDLVNDAFINLQANGHHIPHFLFSFAISIIHNTVTKRLGFDPYNIQPIKFISYIHIPIYITAAMNDDYIPSAHAVKLHQAACVHRTCTDTCILTYIR